MKYHVRISNSGIRVRSACGQVRAITDPMVDRFVSALKWPDQAGEKCARCDAQASYWAARAGDLTPR